MEIAENEDRKSFSKEERINAGIELERIEKIKAEERRKSGKDLTQNFAQGQPIGAVRKIVASYLGMSHTQYEHEKYICSHKDLFPIEDTKALYEFADWDNGKVSISCKRPAIRTYYV